MKKSQKQRVINRLLERGEISRNQCLANYISRLSAIIQDLEEDGWIFETERRGGNYKTEADYIYKVKSHPYKIQEYTNPITNENIKKVIHS